MQVQPAMWLLHVTESELAKKLRMGCAAFFVLVAAALTLWVSPIGGGIAWWGEWLWLWPLLIVACWQLLIGRAPILPAQDIQLTETGRLPGYIITEPLLTPFGLAIRLRPELSTTAPPGPVSIHLAHAGAEGGWQWVFRDQLGNEGWTRLRRVCRNVKQRSL